MEADIDARDIVEEEELAMFMVIQNTSTKFKKH